MSIGSSLSSLGAQKQNKTRWRQRSTCCHFLWVHRNKTKQDDNKHSSSSSFSAQNRNKKDNDKCQGSSSFSITNEKMGDLGEKCACILANMIDLVLQQQSFHHTQSFHQALSKHWWTLKTFKVKIS
jgi:hypothetical protein